MSGTELTNYEDMLTESVLKQVKRYSEHLSVRVHGALSPDDIVQAAIVMMLRREKRPPVHDMVGFLQWRMQCVVFDWTNGWKHEGEVLPQFSTQRERYLATQSLPDTTDHIQALQTPDPTQLWGVLLDVRRAIHTLTPTEQRLVKGLCWDGLQMVEVAEREGVVPETIRRRWVKVKAKLRAVLQEYATPAHGGKRWTGSFEAVPL